MHSRGGEKATAIMYALVAKNLFQFSSIRFVNVAKMLLHIWNLVESDEDVQTLVSCSVKATDFHDRTLSSLLL